MRDTQRFVRFVLVGLTNTILDVFIFLILIRLFDINPVLANVVSYSFAVTNSFFLNTLWTFKAGSKALTANTFQKFLLINTIGLGISTIILLCFKEFVTIEVAKALSVLGGLVWNFFGTSLLFNIKTTNHAA